VGPVIEVDLNDMRGFLLGVSRMPGEVTDRVKDLEVEVAGLVVKTARPMVPVLTGAAARSLRVLDLSDGAAAVGGSPSVKYYAWLEYGGAAGVHHSVHRSVVPEGRYLHPAYVDDQARIEVMMAETLLDAARAAGLA
jgi:hypothetical protein